MSKKIKKRKNFCFFYILLLFVVLALILYNSYSESETKRFIRASMERGQKFIVSSDLKKETYGDNQFCYDHENELVNDCLYKKVDYLLDFVFIKDELPKEEISEPFLKLIKDGELFLFNTSKDWENKKIDFSYIDSSFERGDVALDAYCMVALVNRNRKMFLKVNSTLKSDGWLNEESANKFRRITDESWCIILLSEFNSSEEIIDRLIEKKFEQMREFESKDIFQDNKKFMSYAHLLMMLDEVGKRGYNIENRSTMMRYLQDKLVFFSNKYPNDIEIQHTSLYFLAKTKYPNKIELNKIAHRLVRSQDADGGWHFIVSNKPINRYRILLTCRVILALNQYVLNYF